MAKKKIIIELDMSHGPKALTVANAIVVDAVMGRTWGEYVEKNVGKAGLVFHVEWLDDATLLVRHDSPSAEVVVELPEGRAK